MKGLGPGERGYAEAGVIPHEDLMNTGRRPEGVPTVRGASRPRRRKK